MTPAVELGLTGISKRFGPVVALDDVDFTLAPGRVHALLGENGAGKSTLMAILFGLLRPDHGTIRINGVTTTFATPRDAIRAGVGMVQQHFSHVPALTVAENVALGGRGRFDPAGAARLVTKTAAAAGLQLDPDARVGDLPVGAQQRLEIVRALAHGARTLILDEPTAVLAPGEASELLSWLRRFADDGGSVALVTHKVYEALAVADQISVLRAGRRVSTGNAVAFTPERLAAAMFPGAVENPRVPLRPGRPGTIVASAHALHLAAVRGDAPIAGATFELRAGEVVGIAAVEGAGHVTLLHALAGLEPVAGGSLRLPADVSFIPGDRHRDALVLEFPLYENLALRHASRLRGLMRWQTVRERTRRAMVAFEVHAPSDAAPARSLSGGNQQRFVLARELEPHPPLVVAENPTRGLDLRATATVHHRLLQAAADGAAVVVYSSDLDELLSLAGRVLVVHHGTVQEQPPIRERIAQAMVGIGGSGA